ncbi:unnamed protein product [Fraxinus pennsylvanica]|uniref:Uncharacterized protein n=1 Tax=Fraxinus pennsylvanica TaxID=56036 RepID=A0AAD2A8Q5_9LAMI|nr:unnamed protein product [Fraxinus pennsylvanica]
MLSRRGFDFSTDSDREFDGDIIPINTEATDSRGSTVEGRTASSMHTSGSRSGDKRKCKNRKHRGKKKMYSARDVSASLDHMVTIGEELASIARSYQKSVMPVAECID